MIHNLRIFIKLGYPDGIFTSLLQKIILSQIKVEEDFY